MIMFKFNNHLLFILVVNLSVLRREVIFVQCENVRFKLPADGPFDCTGSIICGGSVSSSNDSLAFLSGENDHELTAGSALFHESIQMLNTSDQRSLSFRTYFEFEVTPGTEHGMDSMTHGNSMRKEGLAFIAVSNKTFIDVGKDLIDEKTKYFGLYVRTTWTSSTDGKNPECNSEDNFNPRDRFKYFGAYLGVDSHSHPWSNYSCADSSNADTESLKEVSTYSVLMEYNGTEQRLQLTVHRMQNNATFVVERPYDIAEYCDERMWIGFYALTGQHVDSYKLTNWSFISYGISAPAVASVSKKVDPNSNANADSDSDSNDETTLVVGLAVGIPLLLLFIAAVFFTAYTVYYSVHIPADKRIHMADLPDTTETDPPLSGNGTYIDTTRCTDTITVRFSNLQPPKEGR